MTNTTPAINNCEQTNTTYPDLIINLSSFKSHLETYTLSYYNLLTEIYPDGHRTHDNRSPKGTKCCF